MSRTRGEAKKVVPLTEEEKRLVEANIPLVWWEVHRSNPRDDHEASEWIQEGVFGLIRAIRSHDPAKSSLSNWMVINIRSVIWSFRRERGGVIAIPRVLGTSKNRDLARKARGVFSMKVVSPVKAVGDWVMRVGERGFHCDIAEEPDVESDENLFLALECLGDEDYELLRRRFFEGTSLEDLGCVMGVSHQRASQKVLRALERLKKSYCRLEGLEFDGLPQRRKTHDKPEKQLLDKSVL